MFAHLPIKKRIIKGLTQFPLIGAFLSSSFKIASMVAKYGLGQVAVTGLLDRLSRLMLKEKGRSHIIVVAAKP
jgi:hypothetical protein